MTETQAKEIAEKLYWYKVVAHENVDTIHDTTCQVSSAWEHIAEALLQASREARKKGREEAIEECIKICRSDPFNGDDHSPISGVERWWWSYISEDIPEKFLALLQEPKAEV